jgi:phenylacetate-CoA ligase
VRDNLALLQAEQLPAGHQLVGERTSSGSTGMVVAVKTTNVWLEWQNALTFRTQLWAGRDLDRPIAVIRRFPTGTAPYPQGLTDGSWAPPFVFPMPTGAAFYLETAGVSLEQQSEWLGRIKPDYLMTYPSIVRALAERAVLHGRPTPLLGISTVGEVVDPETRELAVRYLDAPIYDIYSSEEAGVIALECPVAPVYHAQAEALVVEILDESGNGCAPGETGRVVVTPLFNYAMPLIRYDIGDFAQAGGLCGCGRGLPALERIMGRRRNMLTLSDGRHFWPSFSARRLQKIVPIREHQFRQTAPDVIEALLVTEAPISEAQEAEMRKIIGDALPAPFDIRIRCLEKIPRPVSGKYEEFVSTF